MQVRRPGETWQTVNNPFTVWDETGTIPTLQTPVGEYFAYIAHSANADNILAEWDTTGDQLWEVKLDILGVAGVDTHALQLHNSGPEASIDIDVFAGNCRQVPSCNPAQWSLCRPRRLPGELHARHGAILAAGRGADALYAHIYPDVAHAGRHTWALNTSLMKPCGYVIGVSVVSRAIYNSSPSYTSASGSAGFCLQAA